MAQESGFKPVEFDGNPEPRCACVLLLDSSGSMTGEPINQLNAGLTSFSEAIKKDTLTSLRVEVAIITFGGEVKVMQDFVSAGQFNPPTLTTSGTTPMGGAVHAALDKIQERKAFYKQNGLDYFRPWIFMITDGNPTDDGIWQQAAARSRESEDKKSVAFFAVGNNYPIPNLPPSYPILREISKVSPDPSMQPPAGDWNTIFWNS